MARFLLREDKETCNKITPMLDRMKANRSDELAQLMVNCEAAAKTANLLDEQIITCKINKAELLEELNETDSATLGKFLDDVELALNDVYQKLYGLGRMRNLFAELDVAALIASEKNQLTEEEAEEDR
jgi:hypothetical protein